MLKHGWCCIVLDYTIIYSVVIKACSSMFYLSIVYYFSSSFYNGAFNFLPGSYIRSGEPISYCSALAPTTTLATGQAITTVTYARRNQINNLHEHISTRWWGSTSGNWSLGFQWSKNRTIFLETPTKYQFHYSQLGWTYGWGIVES